MKPVIISSKRPLGSISTTQVALIAVSFSMVVLGVIGVPQFRLVGVNQGHVGQPFAIIENLQSGTQDIFELDRPVFGAATLVSIEKDSITLLDGKELLQLDLKSGNINKDDRLLFSEQRIRNESNSAFSLELADNSLVSDVVNTQDGNPVVVLSDTSVDQYFRESGTNLLSSVNSTRPQPVVENGRMVGLKLSQIDENNFLGQIGLKSGDVVTSVNGQPVNSMREAVASAESSNWSDVEILRDGQPIKVGISLAQTQTQ